MLKTLEIQNLVLVDVSTIHFGPHLNVITGETGSGKSALLSAIGLIMGDRGDTQLILQGKEGARVRAVFAVNGKTLTVERELDISGKSKCWIDEKPAPVASLKAIVKPLIECVDQSSAHHLFEMGEQRHLLDLLSESKTLALQVEELFMEIQTLRQNLDAYTQGQESKERELKWAQDDLSFLEEKNWHPDEEAKLMEEHVRLSNAQDLIQKLEIITQAIEENRLAPVLPILESAARLDPHLTKSSSTLKTLSLELKELERDLASYLNQLEINPHRLTAIEERIAEIEQVKRRFGKTAEEINASKQKIQAKIDHWIHLEEKIAHTKQALEEKEEEIEALASALTDLRKKGAHHFSSLVAQELHRLNFPHARFEIALNEQPLNRFGKDSIHFLFAANLGQNLIPLKECASGGELSRLLFAIKKILSSQEKTSCLIFDEIDGNVGGKTASILGEELAQIAKQKQVICITHFKQVAIFANDHFLVFKQEKEGKTRSLIQKLQEKEKEQEYERMLGIRPLVYTESDSRIGICQGGAPNLREAAGVEAAQLEKL